MVAAVGEGGGDHGCILGSGIGICNEGVGVSDCSLNVFRCCFYVCGCARLEM
jgi:hypothetical protein